MQSTSRNGKKHITESDLKTQFAHKSEIKGK